MKVLVPDDDASEEAAVNAEQGAVSERLEAWRRNMQSVIDGGRFFDDGAVGARRCCGGIAFQVPVVWLWKHNHNVHVMIRS